MTLERIFFFRALLQQQHTDQQFHNDEKQIFLSNKISKKKKKFQSPCLSRTSNNLIGLKKCVIKQLGWRVAQLCARYKKGDSVNKAGIISLQYRRQFQIREGRGVFFLYVPGANRIVVSLNCKFTAAQMCGRCDRVSVCNLWLKLSSAEHGQKVCQPVGPFFVANNQAL